MGWLWSKIFLTERAQDRHGFEIFASLHAAHTMSNIHCMCAAHECRSTADTVLLNVTSPVLPIFAFT
jgi:hypothetical protein